MAKMTIKMPDKFLDSLKGIEKNAGTIIDKALDAGAEIIEKAVLEKLRSVIGSGVKASSRSTGELISSLGVSPPDVDAAGVRNVRIGFNEPRRKQSKAKGKRSYNTATNAMIANTIEYGRHGQPPKPFMKPAKSSSQKQAIEIMKKVVNSEMEL